MTNFDLYIYVLYMSKCPFNIRRASIIRTIEYTFNVFINVLN